MTPEVLSEPIAIFVEKGTEFNRQRLMMYVVSSGSDPNLPFAQAPSCRCRKPQPLTVAGLPPDVAALDPSELCKPLLDWRLDAPTGRGYVGNALYRISLLRPRCNRSYSHARETW
jgi:hypothetical protein